MKLVALDLDGTLEDSRADMVAAIARVRVDLGLPVRPDSHLAQLVFRGMRYLYTEAFDDYLVGAGEGTPSWEDLRARYESDYLENIRVQTALYDGVKGGLEALVEQGATLAVVTNKPERLSRALLDALGILSFFGAVIGGDTCPKSKPDPMPLREAARQVGARLGLDPVWMVGDSAGDLAVARGCDATAVWCAWGYHPNPGSGAVPDVVLNHPDELVGLLART